MALAVLEDLLRPNAKASVKSIYVVASARSESVLRCITEHPLIASSTCKRLRISAHLTGSSSGTSTPSENEKEDKLSSPQDRSSILSSRADLQSIIRHEVNRFRPCQSRNRQDSLYCVACGPSSFMLDVKSEVASIQRDILFGRKGRVAAVGLVSLQCEAFGW